MKRKNLIYVSLSLVALLGMSACDTTPKLSSNQGSVQGNTSTSGPVSSSGATDSAATTSSTGEDVNPPFVDPTPAPTAESLPAGTEVRNYMSDFDQMVDDFSSNTPVGTLSETGATYQSKPFLKVPLHSTWGTGLFPGTPDAAIYKVASGSEFNFLAMDGIGIRVRLAKGSENISLDQLVFGLRADDSHQVYPIKFSEAKDVDGEDLPALTEEYQDLIISVKESITDDETVYNNNDGSPSSLKLSEAMIGFHIYATGDCKSDIEIEEVFGYNGSTRKTVDAFERENVGTGDPSVYWRGSVGSIEKRNVEIAGGSYKVSKADATDMENVAIAIKGDTTGTSIKAIKRGGNDGVTKTWADLKDSQNNALPAALKNSYSNLVVNLANSGLDADTIGLEISSTTAIKVSTVFLTDLNTAVKQDYPTLDSNSFRVFDSFNRTQTTFTSNWENSALDSNITDAGLNGCVSYTFEARPDIEIKEGELTFKATESYSDLVEGSKTARNGAKYLVFSMYADAGASFDNFRIKAQSTGDAIYFNDWYASELTKSKDTPYKSGRIDYAWYVIDLELTGLGAMTDQLFMYYTGAGAIHIDEVFFADAQSKTSLNAKSENILSADVTLDATSADYIYGYGGNIGADMVPVLALTLVGDGTATLASFRIQLGSTIWFKDGMKDTNGDDIAFDIALPTSPTTIYIDLEASGFDMKTTDRDIHLHYGSDSEHAVLTVKGIGTYDYAPGYNASLITNPVTAQNNAYTYIGGNAGGISGPKTLTMTVIGDLSTMRLGNGASDTYWAKDGQIILADGSTLDVSSPFDTETTIVIDLVKTGFTSSDQIHIHNGGEESTSVTFNSIVLEADNTPYADVFSGHYSA